MRGLRHPLVDEWLEVLAPEVLQRRGTHGRCAEPINISEWLFRAEEALKIPKGSLKIEQAREIFSSVISKAKAIQNNDVDKLIHRLDKQACRSCNPLLKYFNIIELK